MLKKTTRAMIHGSQARRSKLAKLSTTSASLKRFRKEQANHFRVARVVKGNQSVRDSLVRSGSK